MNDAYFDPPETIQFDVDDITNKKNPCEFCNKGFLAKWRIKKTNGLGIGVDVCDSCYESNVDDLEKLIYG